MGRKNIKNNSYSYKNEGQRISALILKYIYIKGKQESIGSNAQLIKEKALNITLNNQNEFMKVHLPTAYNYMEQFSVFEYSYTLCNDICRTTTFKPNKNSSTEHKHINSLLTSNKNICEKWKKIRNKIGGHIDIEFMTNFCKNKNFKGMPKLNIKQGQEYLFYNNLLTQIIIFSMQETNSDTKLFNQEIESSNQTFLLEQFSNKLSIDYKKTFENFDLIMEFVFKKAEDWNSNN